jgi:hypothetical protein
MRTQLTAVDNDMRALRHRIGGEPKLAPGERPAALPGAAPVGLPRGSNGPALDDVPDAELVERPHGPGDGGAAEDADDISRPDDI